jgi:hypothetical protein
VLFLISGHTNIQPGNVVHKVSEHSVARYIIGVDNKDINYDCDTNKYKYEIIKYSNFLAFSNKDFKLGIIHIPISNDIDSASLSRLIYNEKDIDSYLLAKKISTIFSGYNINIDIVSSSKYVYDNFVLRYSSIPTIIIEPFSFLRVEDQDIFLSFLNDKVVQFKLIFSKLNNLS